MGQLSIIQKQLNWFLKGAIGNIQIDFRRLNQHLKGAMGYLPFIHKRHNRGPSIYDVIIGGKGELSKSDKNDGGLQKCDQQL